MKLICENDQDRAARDLLKQVAVASGQDLGQFLTEWVAAHALDTARVVGNVQRRQMADRA